MRLHLHTETATLSVSDALSLKRLDAVVHGIGSGAVALGRHGSLDGDHIWIEVAWLQATAGAGQNAEWHRGFDGMLSYAAAKGWTNPPGTRLRVHLTPA